MYNKILKLVIALSILTFAILQFIDNKIGNGIMLIILSGFFVFLYFRNEILLLAFFSLRKQDLEKTKKLLNKIKNPSTALTRKQEGYYNYLNGIIVSQTNMNLAEKYFKKAISFGLSMDHDLAMSKLNLAGIALSKRRPIEAKKLLNEAEKIDTRGMLKDQIKMMKNNMKKSQGPKQNYSNRQQMRFK